MKRNFITILLSGVFALNAMVAFGVQNTENNLSKTLQNTTVSQIIAGYCSQKINSSLGGGAGATVKAGILLPASTTKMYVGNKLIKLRIGMGNATYSNAQMFLSYDKSAAPFYTQQVTLTPGVWNELTLTTPYTVENKDLFISYSVVTGATSYYPIGIDEGPAVVNGDWFSYTSSNGTVTNWLSLLTQGYSFNISLQAVIEGNTLPTTNVELSQLVLPKYVKAGKKFVIEGKVKNLAVENVNSLKLVCQYLPNKYDTISISGLNITSGLSGIFKTDSIQAVTEGAHNFAGRIISVNNKQDEDTTNNKLTKSLLIYNNSFKRNVLLEHFTTAKCVNCPPAHERLSESLAGRNNIIHVAHHAGYLTDIYTTTESKSYLWLFNPSTSAYAPAIILDRTNLYDYKVSQATLGSPVFFPETVTDLNRIFDIKTANPAFISVNIKSDYNTQTRDLKITVTGKKDKFFSPVTAARMNLFITEDSLILAQTGSTNPNYRHDDVLRDVASLLWGDVITFNTDSTYSVTYEYGEIPAAWVARRMNITAFVADYKNTNPNNCEVYNAARTPLIQVISGVSTVLKNETFAYSKNNRVHIDGNFRNCRVFDVSGRLLKSIDAGTTDFQLENNGIYILQLESEGKTATQKIVIN